MEVAEMLSGLLCCDVYTTPNAEDPLKKDQKLTASSGRIVGAIALALVAGVAGWFTFPF